jgi:hypothetical protein
MPCIEAYAGYPLEAMLEELDFFDDFDRSDVVSLESRQYVIWMVPSSDEKGANPPLLPPGAL